MESTESSDARATELVEKAREWLREEGMLSEQVEGKLSHAVFKCKHGSDEEFLVVLPKERHILLMSLEISFGEQFEQQVHNLVDDNPDFWDLRFALQQIGCSSLASILLNLLVPTCTISQRHVPQKTGYVTFTE